MSGRNAATQSPRGGTRAATSAKRLRRTGPSRGRARTLSGRAGPGVEPPYPWSGACDPDYARYMREEWGYPVHDDRRLFEMLSLECFQAGLSWASILKRRATFRRAFSNWTIAAVAAYGPRERARLLRDPGIIRNARKIEAVIANAAAALALRREFGSLDAYFWGLVGGRPITRNKGRCRRWQDLPAQTEESRNLARDLKRRGFRFVGPVACYAFMQAVGLVDDRIAAIA